MYKTKQSEKQKERDINRAEYLEKFRSFKVIRINNEDVFKITDYNILKLLTINVKD